MGTFNQVILMGHLGDNPQAGRDKNDKPWCRLSLATHTTIGDEKVTQWHRICLFGRQAEIAAQYLKKGSPAHITGRLDYQKHETEDGDRWTTTIIAHQLTLVGGAQKSEPATGDQSPVDDDPPF